jgi:short-subunit dehydrogenase
MIELHGSVALVTGASSGIGAAFAAELAGRGADLVLVARSADQLEALAERLRAAHQVRAEVITADLSQPDAAAQVRAEVERRGLQVDLLVNNAGFGSTGPFDKLSPERSRREVSVDVTAVVDMTHAFLPGMVARRKGGIINVASIAAFQPTPYMAVYAAAKAFVLSFSEALWAEQEANGVQVTAVCPGPVRTRFAEALGTPQPEAGKVLSAEEVAREGLRAFERGRFAVTPGLGNKLLHMVQWLPRRLVLVGGRRFLAKVVKGFHSPDLPATRP